MTTIYEIKYMPEVVTKHGGLRIQYSEGYYAALVTVDDLTYGGQFTSFKLAKKALDDFIQMREQKAQNDE